MLPFLDKNKIGTVIASKMSKGKIVPEDMPESQETGMGLESAAEDIIAAIDAKDSGALAAALKNAFEILEEMPHEEGPHIGE